jgi:hypothetical protein
LRDEAAAGHLQRHADDEQIAVAQQPPAHPAADQMQAVVEGAEHPHHLRRRLVAELQRLRGVEHQGGIKHRITQGRDQLDEEQHGGAGGDALQRLGECGHEAVGVGGGPQHAPAQ